jgi:uncharacterized protein (DUF433 family)
MDISRPIRHADGIGGGFEMAWEDRIAVDPAILTGKPTIKGTRIAVAFLVELVAEGWTTEEIVRNYPGIGVEDVRASINQHKS